MILLVGSTLSVFAQQPLSSTDIITCSSPELRVSDTSTSILLPEATTYLHNTGQPQLPVIRKTYSYPRGTIINTVEVIASNIHTLPLDVPVSFAQRPHIQSEELEVQPATADLSIYESNALFPSAWSEYTISVGSEHGQPLTFVTITMYPVRYHPGVSTLTYAQQMNIDIDVDLPEQTAALDDVYDLLIISPLQFTRKLQRLVDHKEDMGIRTKLITTQHIYRGFDGQDQAEKIKNFLYVSHEEWGYDYVLLVGGMKGQRFWSWHVPVRYSNLDDNSSFETSYISDLYYADLYKYDESTGYSFDDWDSNGNGVFAEWTADNKDVLDMVPDLSIGRLPVRYLWDLDIVIDKIITYETTTFGSEWFQRIAGLGGDSFNDSSFNLTTDYAEGKEETEKAMSFMPGFEQIRIWPEGGDITFTTENALEELNRGHGFVYFTGHGNPSSWVTFPHNDFETKIPFKNSDIRDLSNGEKLPVLIVGGCHNCQFDCTPLRFLTKGKMAYYYGEMTPKSWGWLYASLRSGGSIATIGNTGLGYGTVGDGPFDEIPDNEPDGIPDCIQFLGGWIEPHFFEIYNNSVTTLGDVHAQCLIDYLQNFSIDWEMDWENNAHSATLVDCKTVQQWVLFGDPTLRIGGYPPIL